MGYFLEIVAALVASYLLTPAVAFTWLRQTAAPRPAALQQRSTAVARSQGGFQAILRAASATTCRDCDLCADPFCGCAMCAAKGSVLEKGACDCSGVCLCPGGFAQAAHAPGCQCDQCSH